jgi:hypothetical protein
MVLDNKVFISIMFCVTFCAFLSSDIPIVLKCLLHVSIIFLWVLFLALYYKVLSFFILCFQYCELLLPIKLRETWFIWFWFKFYHVVTMFQRFQNMFFFFHIPRACSRLIFGSIQQNCLCNQVAICCPMLLDGWG